MNRLKLPAVHAMHWNNIADVVLAKQRLVFEHLQIELIQENAHKTSHGVWMNDVIARSTSQDIILFCDIDAFPLRRSAYLKAIEAAERGAVFGMAQFSNHKKGTELYAGPMFMAFRKSTWEALGSPSLKSSSDHDAAEVMSALARKSNIELVLSRPSSCLIPKWALGNQGVFGIGTFYGDNDFFHLFESREPAYEQLLVAVADDVIAQRSLQFARYLEAVRALQQPSGMPARKKRRWWRRLLS